MEQSSSSDHHPHPCRFLLFHFIRAPESTSLNYMGILHTRNDDQVSIRIVGSQQGFTQNKNQSLLYSIATTVSTATESRIDTSVNENNNNNNSVDVEAPTESV
ncbi:hypothetical protein Tco_1081007 [Tanacetum coccineum]|uniref:Uncharacterized protein n=1 Tax=Tanacetum coccineum TaxID=301880 RepID=A0ABQ5HWA8_9ASTR